MFRRRQVKTQRQLMREELGESLQHFRMAIAHARGGSAAAVGPRVDAAKRSVTPTLRKATGATIATVAPLALAARKGRAKLMREEPRVRRWPKMVGGLLVAGAAAGAVGAVVARRRANRNQWEQYGTTTSTTETSRAGLGSAARSTVESGKDKIQSLADSAKERAAELRAGGSTTDTTAEFGTREDLYGKSATTGSNHHSGRS